MKINSDGGDYLDDAMFTRDAGNGGGTAGDPSLVDAGPYRRRWRELDRLADPWKPLWREVNEYVLPWSGRFLHSDRDQPEIRRGQNIHNSVTHTAIQTAASGLHGGLTSPSRPWFEIAHPDEEMMEVAAVKQWLQTVQNRQRQVLAQSNFYAAVQDLYYEALAYGQGVALIDADPQSVVRFRTLTCGEYLLANGDDLRVNTVYRKFGMTAAQIRGRFGAANLPEPVRRALQDNKLDQVFHLIQAIQPWGEFTGARHAEWSYESAYFFEDGRSGETLFARRGYRSKPFVAVRWGAIGESPYGHSPGQMALADIRQLQTQERAYVNAVNWIADPAWLVSDSVKDQLARGEIRPGAIIGASPQDGQHLFRPLLRPIFDFANIRLKIQDVQERIQAMFYNPLFLMVQNRTRQMTATEVMQLVEEKALVLGPVIERFQAELFDPVLSRVFDVMDRGSGLVPPPPPQIQGDPLRVQYVSILAQAQKQVGMSGINHFMMTAAEIMRVFPEAAIKIDAEEMIDQIALSDNVPHKVVRSDDEVAELKKAAQAGMAEQAGMDRMGQMAGLAKTLGDTPMGEGNLLDAAAADPGALEAMLAGGAE